MREALLNLALAGSVLAGIFKFCEWLLPASSQARIASAMFEFWNWIDDLQRHRLLMRFDRGRPQFVVAALSQIISLFALVYILYATVGPIAGWDTEIYVKLGGSIIGSLFSLVIIFMAGLPACLRWSSRASCGTTYLCRVFGILLLSDVVSISLSLPAASTNGIHDYDPDTLQLSVLSLLSQGGLGFLSGMSVQINIAFTIFFLLSIISVVGLGLVKLFVSAFELVARRLNEAPNGPLLAASGIIGALAAFIKLFGK